MTTKEHRKAIPLGVKLHACLLLLGFTDEEIAGGIQWDHTPALGFREIVDGVMIPAPNDPHHIVPMRTEKHREKTSGRKNITVAGSDQHMMGKIRRLTGETPKRPKAKIRSRKQPWPKRKFRNG